MNTPQERSLNREIAWLAGLAACVSIAAFLIYFHRGEILLYGDAVAHINIARRVLDSRTPGLLQLGTVWLPLPHLLVVPFVSSDWMWRTGVGGSLPSMLAYVLGVAGIFRLVRVATSSWGSRGLGSRKAAWFAAGIYGLNPSLLYLQATAMTESLYLALFIWAVVYFAEFLKCKDAAAGEWPEEARSSLWKCGLCLTGASLTRYDGWFVACVLCGLVLLLARYAQPPRPWGTAARFVLLAALAPCFWVAYNAVVYRNPLEFANGPYSAKAIEEKTAVPGFPPHPGTHNLPIAALYFIKAGEFAMAEGNWQRAWLALALFGTVALVLRDRQMSALVPLWLPVPFYMLSVAYGGVPIFTPVWWPQSLYNIRYGVQLLPALAVFMVVAAHYLVLLASGRVKPLVVAGTAVCFVVVSYALVWRAGPGCFREAWVNSRTRLQLEGQLAQELRNLPAESSFLMYLGEHVGALQDAGVPLRRAIYEGNHRVWKQPADPEGLWERTLANPSQNTDFVVAFEGDPVWQAVHTRGFPVVATIVVPGQKTASILRAGGTDPVHR